MTDRLIHYSAVPLLTVYSAPQPKTKTFLPRGLWFSAEGNGDGWREGFTCVVFQTRGTFSFAHRCW